MREFTDISLMNILPPSIAHDASIQAAAKAIDKELSASISFIENIERLGNIREITDSALIDLLAWDFHVDFYDPALPLESRRELVAKSLEWHFRKGTPSAVEEVVSAAFGYGEVNEWFEYGGEPYFFRISTSQQLYSSKEYEQLIAAVWSVKNTRSWLDLIRIVYSGRSMLHAGAVTLIEASSKHIVKELRLEGIE